MNQLKGSILLLGLLFSTIILSCNSTNNKGSISENDTKASGLDTFKTISARQLQNYKRQLHQVFDTGLIKKRFNGAVLIAKDGLVLYEAYIGYKDPLQKRDTIDEQTAFHLASTTKPFTGMAILRLVEQGQLHLNDPITQFFPAFPYPEVTIKQLLSHRSGLPNYLFFMEEQDKWPKNKSVTNQDVLNFLINYRPPLNFKPGSRFNYCNTNYVLLASIIEKIAGKTFPAYMKETIFTPLGMQHTFVYTPADAPRAIMSYKPSGALWADDMFDDTYGDKNIYSTVRDLMKWDSALYSPQFIRPSLLDSAYQPQSHEKPSIHNYGLGWRLLNFPNGKNVIYHFGKWHGFTPAFARLTDERAVIIVLGNQYNQNIYESAKTAYSVFGDYKREQDSALLDEEIKNNGNPPASAPLKEKIKTATLKAAAPMKAEAIHKEKVKQNVITSTLSTNNKKSTVKQNKAEPKSVAPKNAKKEPPAETNKSKLPQSSKKLPLKQVAPLEKKPVTSSKEKKTKKEKTLELPQKTGAKKK